MAGLKVLCVTPDTNVLKVSARMGWKVSADTANDLNGALTQVINSFSETPLMIVLPDLPLLKLDSLKNVLRLGREYGCTICPDLRMEGTNILYVADSRRFKPSFGPDSFKLHLNQLRRFYKVKIFVELGTALDIDTPADLLLLSRLIKDRELARLNRILSSQPKTS